MSRHLLRPAFGLTRADFQRQLAVRSQPFSTSFAAAADDNSADNKPAAATPRVAKSQAAASEISSMLKSSPRTGPAVAAPGTPATGPNGARVVNVRSLPRGRGRGGLRLGGGAMGTVVRNPDGTVSVRRMAPSGGPRGPRGPAAGDAKGKPEGQFRSSRGGSRGGRGGGRTGGGGGRMRGKNKGKDGEDGERGPGRHLKTPYDAMAEDIDWYAPYTKEELQVLAERPPAAPERKAEVFVPKLGVDEILEYAPALATDSNILGKAATIRSTLKTIAGGPVDPGHLAHPKMMAAKYDYLGVMYFEKLQTKEVLEERTDLTIKMGPDDRLKDVLVRRTVKGQYEPVPAVAKNDVVQLTRNYHLKEGTYTRAATDKFQAKLEQLLAKAKPRPAASR